MAASILRSSLSLNKLTKFKAKGNYQLEFIRKRTNTESGSFLPAPDRQPYGLLGVSITVLAGLFVGATISQNIASFLEENELFVPSDDDDDDD